MAKKVKKEEYDRLKALNNDNIIEITYEFGDDNKDRKVLSIHGIYYSHD